MDILFLIDRVELKYFEFNDLVTNFWLIREFIRNGNDVFITTIDKLGIKSEKAFAHCYRVFENDDDIFYAKNEVIKNVEDFRLVMLRNDPPVDLDYINATYVLDFVDKSKTIIMNNPKSVRDFNEKLHAMLFSDLMPEHIVTSSKSDIMEFLNTHEEIVLKPLNKCFGAGVMTLKKHDKNTSVIINMMTNNGTTLVMIQKYLEKAKFGDKRVLFLGEEILPYCVQKLPSNDDFKFNEHCDTNIIRAELTESEQEKFKYVARKLNSMGIYMAGLDVIDEKIIEINVTSPCYFIREINNHFNVKLEKKVTKYLQNFVESKTCAQQLR